LTRRRAAIGALFLLSAGLSAAAIEPQQRDHHEGTRVSMACTYAIDAYGPDASTLPAAVEAAFDEVDRIDRLMSNYKPESPLSRLNREAANRPVAVEPELFDFIAASMDYNRESDGAFDITVGPLMKAWGFFRGEGHFPAADDLAAARRRVGGAHVVLNRADRTISFDTPGVELDLGGIAKGYAVDRAADVLRTHGVTSALISAGGSSIYGLGAPPDRAGWDVSVQDPVAASKTALTVTLRDRALSVAGSSEKSFEAGGIRYSHIMDPRLGAPVQGMLSVAVLSRTAMSGDALDDAFFVLGVEGSRRYLRRLTDTEAMFFLPTEPHSWKMMRVKSVH
jgi:thiamine biosynthesis lipoprotein